MATRAEESDARRLKYATIWATALSMDGSFFIE